ncbi:hypothetical protein SynNOUM97013_01743 [Synechococcus sp. NOUM97013]|nr:hypothetical protein SynNOUM97013_01743 [Synechococcus sp. NOUM97013]
MLNQSSHEEERSLWGWDPRGLFFGSTAVGRFYGFANFNQRKGINPCI